MKKSNDDEVVVVPRLRLSKDTKVEQLSTIANSFGLMPIVSCPGASTVKGGCAYIEPGSKSSWCYAHRLTQFRKATAIVLTNNLLLLRDTDHEGRLDNLRVILDKFRAECRYEGLASPIFRIHWAGDFFSESYMRAWMELIPQYPDIKFWTYTRSVQFIKDEYFRIKNLSMYISIDDTDKDIPRIVGARYSYVGETNTHRARICASSKCATCLYCVNRKSGNVYFKLRK